VADDATASSIARRSSAYAGLDMLSLDHPARLSCEAALSVLYLERNSVNVMVREDFKMSAVNILEVPQDVLDSARLTIPEVKAELAVYLYAQGRLSIGKARELAGMTLWEFRQLLASRRISPHYDVEDLDEDVATLRVSI
jgi:predicted HTH domain antitoxin